MDALEIRKEFLRCTHKVNHVREPFPTASVLNDLRLKLTTMVVSRGPQHILRRPRRAMSMHNN